MELNIVQALHSVNVAEAIPYTSNEERIRIVGRELKKGRYIEVWDELKVVYSTRKWRHKQ